MAGYIGKSQGVTQVDGYNRTEADGRYVNASGDTMTGALGIGTAPTTSPSTMLHVREDDSVDHLARIAVQSADQMLVAGSKWQAGVEQYSFIKSTNAAETVGQPMRIQIGDNTALGIDYYGRVTMPYQPHFVVKANYGSHTVLNSVSPDWSVVYRNNGGHFNTSTNTFTVPVTGLYFFRTHALIDKSANSGYNYAYAQFYFNGTLYTDIAHTPSNGTTSYIDIALTAVVYLQAGDTVQARYTTVNGAAFYAGSTYNAFSGYLVS